MPGCGFRTGTVLQVGGVLKDEGTQVKNIDRREGEESHVPLGAVFLKTFTAFTIEVGLSFSDERERDESLGIVCSTKNNSGMT